MTTCAAYPDVYFTPGYGGAARDEGFESWCSIQYFDGRWQMPLIIRRAPGLTLDATSPYGYSGIYASPELTAEQQEDAWNRAVAELRGLGVVSVFLRHSPLVPQASAHTDQIPLTVDHPTVVIDVRSVDQMWASLEGRCRTAVRKAVSAGFSAEVRAAEAADLATGSPFRVIYEETMQRREAGSVYFFDDGYYDRLRAALGDNLFIAEARSSDGEVGAVCLLMAHERFLHYHLSGSRGEAARSGANNLMLWEACRFAASRGMEMFHLGGGLRADDALHRFKRSFGGRRGAYRTSGLILDREKYEQLSDVTGPDDGFFPAYRRGSR